MSRAATLETVYAALVGGLDGMKFSSGEVLSAEGHESDLQKISAGQLPYMGLATGSIETSEWGSEDWTDEIRWTIPARLILSAPVNDRGREMRLALTDIMQHVRKMRGLLCDEDGALALDDLSSGFVARVNSGELQPLADRKGPHLFGIRVAGPNDSGFYIADLNFRLAFLMNLDPRALQRAQVAVLGMRPYDVARSDIDLSLPGMPAFADADRRATGAFANPGAGPRVSDNGIPAQIGQGQYELRFLPLQVRVAPGSASIAAPATSQLYAVCIMQDDSAQQVAASWASSNDLVATVSSNGLVTGVSAGSVTITATYAGLSGTAAITVT